MTMQPMKRDRTWYVVMNAGRARILRGLPNERDPAQAEIILQGPRQNLRDRLQDRPARSFASCRDGRRSAVEPGTDPMHEDARRFLRDVFDFLLEQHRARAFDGLVLIGSPDIVGLWREEIPDTLRDCMRAEMKKNLVRWPAARLVPALRALSPRQSPHR